MNLSPLQLQRQLAPLRPLGLVALAWLVLLLLFRDTAGAMVEMWRSNDTFAHAFLVLPITLGLVWMRRAHLQGLPVRPQPWLLAVVAVVGAGWLLAELATVGVVAQFALVGLMVTAVPLVLGWAWFQALLFPLFFLFFAVPFGDSAVPQLMAWTADFTVFALKATGIPVYREGLLFVIPSGSWSVVQACSGVRYLIASFMVGTLFAYLNYVSLRRRLLFVLVSLLVPIVANWLRAYMIVMIGHLSNNELAAGVDHLIYGWVFFGLVIGAMFWVGSRWAQAPLPPPAAASTTVAATPASAWVGAGLFVAALLAVQGLTWQLSRPSGLPPPVLSLATLTSPPWQPAPAPTVAWTPGFLNPLSVATGHWQQDGRTVSVWLGYYRDQGPDRKLVSSFNGLAGHDDKVWAVFGLPGRAASGELPAFRRSDLRQGKALDALKAQRMRVWHLYWIGGRWVTSDVRAKLYQAADRVQGRGDDGAVVVLYTPAEADADATLEKFARQRLGALGTVLAAARETR